MNYPNNEKQVFEKREDEEEGLVLSVSDYKDSDGILYLLQPNRILSVYARGIQKQASKNRRLAMPFSKVRLVIDPRYSREMQYLIRGSVVWFDHKIQDSLLDSAICFVLRDVILSEGPSSVIYRLLEKAWHGFDRQNRQEGLLYACMILAEEMKRQGIAPQVEECAGCGRKDTIETMSMEEGGFLCHSCRKESDPVWKKEDLRKIRAIFRVREKDAALFLRTFRLHVKDFLYLCSWLEYHMARTWASVRFLETVAKMEKD